MKRSRDWRRFQKYRMRARAEKKLLSWAYFSREDASKQARYMADNFCVCSKGCCGNPRKWFGDVGLQEKRFIGWQKRLSNRKEILLRSLS